MPSLVCPNEKDIVFLGVKCPEDSPADNKRTTKVVEESGGVFILRTSAQLDTEDMFASKSSGELSRRSHDRFLQFQLQLL